MKILADQNIPYASEAFADLGDVHLFVGRELKPQQVLDADVLLVRSVTQVNASLLNGSSVRFVATATIGTDHIDLDYLAKHNIGFASAPGSNATSASEYVLAALLLYANETGIDVTNQTVGIVGYGNVGSRVAKLLDALGIELKIYDPPRAEKFNDVEYCGWQDILACDVVTAHVPLTRTGSCPTYKMFNKEFFAALKPDSLFINTARGQAVDEQALHKALENKNINLILDVWCNEPQIDKTLLQKTLISTPHIAGYAYDGKLRGTEMIYQAVCRHFNHEPNWSVAQVLGNQASEIPVTPLNDLISELNSIVKQAYSIRRDSDELRRILQMNDEDSAIHFDMLRKHYPKRREFSHYKIAGQPVNTMYNQLGFIV